MKHTPGPWRLNIDEDTGMNDSGCILDSVGHVIVTDIYGTFKNGRTTGEAEANARLIAASPAMYGKLKDTVAWLDREIKNRRDTRDRMDDEVNQFMNLDTGFQLERLTELRDDLAETLRKIEAQG